MKTTAPNNIWLEIARLVLTSRKLDDIEEKELFPQKRIALQFSAKGHELAQIVLGSRLTNPRDAVSGYYRSRPLLLSLGLSTEDAFASALGKSGAFSDGRDSGVVYNLPSQGRATVLPMAGDVGSQYTPIAGWAQALLYHHRVLGDESYADAVAVATGGEGSVSTNGFWAALNIATTRVLPMLFFIEDNGYAISVPSAQQTPGGNITRNLQSFHNLLLEEGDGTDPQQTLELVDKVLKHIRAHRSPALLRLRVPRLAGHSAQDSQAYKSKEVLRAENERDPLPKLQAYLSKLGFSAADWTTLVREVEDHLKIALQMASHRPGPDPQDIAKYCFAEVWPSSTTPVTTGPRINMAESIRLTLRSELASNPKLLIFGEDVGPKGGVHTETLGLQQEFGEERVFDTSLSEEGIIGSAVGLALSGLKPAAEIQFRKYADAATEQLNNCGTIRWRTSNRFSAPIVVRMPVGHARRAGDPWHSVCGEAVWAHQVGWRIIMPSNAADASGLLRAALRGNDPVFFFEHRALLDSPLARRPYPGDSYVLQLGQAEILQRGTSLTVITWGAMVERCLHVTQVFRDNVEVIDLRTICPWDKETVFESVRKTKRCAIVHEDNITLGFGAEIAAQIVQHLFYHLDAPIVRIAPPDLPIPYNPELRSVIVPSEERIMWELKALLEF